MGKVTIEETRHSEILKTIGALKTPLLTVALLGLVDEFYTKEERQKLYAEYLALCSADDEAYQNMSNTKAKVDPDLAWEPRVKKYGEETATEQVAPQRQAFEEKQASAIQVRVFEKEHNMIVSLMKLKKVIG